MAIAIQFRQIRTERHPVIAAENLFRRYAIGRRINQSQVEALKGARRHELSVGVLDPIGVLLVIRQD
jgi:hypothetical protein